ncbi:MAG: type IX secretion system membrane protein PorP/SprF [Bacteroidia bacterium]|nr:type IX secretion system membrane protein PorP/SprF [Bacteroidia bacterium]
MRQTVLLLLVAVFLRLHSQPAYFNQYNGVMGTLNPALIIGPDRGQFSLIARSQWRNHPMHANLGSLSVNLYSSRINQALGFFAEYKDGFDTQNTASTGLRWAYRVVFLDKMYLCAGAGLKYTKLDLAYPYPTFTASPEFAPWPYPLHRQYLSSDFGITLYGQAGKYAGFSLRDIHWKVLDSDTLTELSPGKTWSVHGLYHFAVTRASQVLLFASFDRGFEIRESNATYSLVQFQANYYIHKKIVAGLGYKRVGPYYGHMTWRAGFFLFGEQALISYSYDMKPYILNNKIHWNPSHELLLKIRLQDQK